MKMRVFLFTDVLSKQRISRLFKKHHKRLDNKIFYNYYVPGLVIVCLSVIYVHLINK